MVNVESTSYLISSRGSTAVDVPANRFVIDNATNGSDLHRLDNGTQLRTYETGLHERRIPKQVVFAEDGRLVVGGSDHGKIYLFDRDSGRLLGILPHARRQVVQTVTILQNQDWAFYNPWLYKQMLHSMHTWNVKLTSTKTLGSVPPSVPPPIPQDAALYMAAVQDIVQKTLKDMSTAQLMQDFGRVSEKREAETAKRQRRNAEKSIIFASYSLRIEASLFSSSSVCIGIYTHKHILY
ncbi:hypothetical protein M422DRAFT_269222 [Sphaerobolus stellatus SS14]|uniref:Uncharacterized protein n=1 Tax=Sphaerobolus stellatus (strain SS14) TaxID=990650 RepID=A0A0C9UW79_SPHS4|nr:hypothetical protein M422DRAFT_269222 [Sphaerobolus stellatus SS14]